MNILQIQRNVKNCGSICEHSGYFQKHTFQNIMRKLQTTKVHFQMVLDCKVNKVKTNNPHLGSATSHSGFSSLHSLHSHGFSCPLCAPIRSALSLLHLRPRSMLVVPHTGTGYSAHRKLSFLFPPLETYPQLANGITILIPRLYTSGSSQTPFSFFTYSQCSHFFQKVSGIYPLIPFTVRLSTLEQTLTCFVTCLQSLHPPCCLQRHTSVAFLLQKASVALYRYRPKLQ